MATEKTGQCLCGAVRLTISSPPSELSVCHCGMCRRWTGSAFVTIDVAPHNLHIEGAGHVRAYASSDWASRSFCDTCGTTLWYRLKDAPGHDDYYIAAGLLDDLTDIRLTREIYIDAKPDAWAFAGPTEKMTEAELLASMGISADSDPAST
ncbi:GFA family protein [Rhodobacter sp. 24-YEA-8]|uniref:GFA family protein n=1 Tax=Rhodobacter sp. 24-YEA-8 TaxID=1884310 RepID=UPI000896FE60|nr:GFA family protein [Rhodobacter sp. 24-YEA-8]SEC77326.1 Uncharacterized conserved protein [Rhodobacter sp. 24-YEA-8]